MEFKDKTFYYVGMEFKQLPTRTVSINIPIYCSPAVVAGG